jgi:hypothetical protein
LLAKDGGSVKGLGVMEHAEAAVPASSGVKPPSEPGDVSFRHLKLMTDDTGLLEHSLGYLPRRQEGYTTDDNARALWLCLEWLELDPGKAQSEGLAELADIYASFLLWAQRPDGSFHNNFAYDRRPEDERSSDDCLGRTVWALALAASASHHDRLRFAARRMLDKAFPRIPEMAAPRGWAYALAACSRLHLRGADVPAGLISELEARLLQMYRKNCDSGWRWFEPVISYGNGLLPWALFQAYAVTCREETLRVAEESFGFLLERMTAPQGWIRPVGNKGWCTKEACSQWDQQPLDAMKLALAAEAGFRIVRKPVYRDTVERCRKWFYGCNDGAVALADPADGSCCDGLTQQGPNVNRGAESTLSFLLTEALYARIQKEEKTR